MAFRILILFSIYGVLNGQGKNYLWHILIVELTVPTSPDASEISFVCVTMFGERPVGVHDGTMHLSCERRDATSDLTEAIG